jgi:arginine deiminase
MMEELLFDDILYGEAARKEHRRFRRVLETLGVEVLQVGKLLAEVLKEDEARRTLLEPLQDVVAPALVERLQSAPADQLARLMTSGVRRDSHAAMDEMDDLFEIPPVPNLCFQRDPQIVLGHQVIIASMATPARRRESLLASVLFRYHPRLSAVPRLLEPLASGPDHAIHLGPRRPRFEGGDVLVLSPEVIAVGVSQRTNRSGVQSLVRALQSLEGGPRSLILVSLPVHRAYMHLDTVMTPVDHDACLIYPPLIEPDAPGSAQVFEIDLHAKEPVPKPRPSLLGALRLRRIDLEPIPCGGDDPVVQQREQWTDGANALAVSPGIILLYDRNVATAEVLHRAGFSILSAKELLYGRSGFRHDKAQRTCILLPSNEISRARGGPHCLSHPLWRDALP